MLTIRKAQLDALTADLLVQYKDRLLRQFTSAYPVQFSRLQEEGMRALIERGVDTAIQYHIETERDVAAFITLALRTTGDIETMIQRESVRRILEDDTLAGEFKVQLIQLQLNK